VPRATCSVCDEPSRSKLAAIYWGWRWPSGDRRAFAQRFDSDCIGASMTRIRKSNMEPDICVHCGGEAKYPNSIEVYATIYIPGRDRDDAVVTYCEPCFVQEESLYIQNARRLDDREGGGGGPPASTSRADPWAAIGLHP